ncbi:MAG: hypothetical protein COC01_04275 [Bacteroidetes bacterium]|nr:MAG: hypothetical protein COC01_04275 [Bacteroidota bacterium]
MSFLKKYSGVLIITALFLSYSSNCYSQKSNNSNTDEMQIVHNDKTGIVLDVVKKNKKQYQIRVEDKITGHIYSSIPTKIKAKQGDEVMYTELCHSTCRIERKCKK